MSKLIAKATLFDDEFEDHNVYLLLDNSASDGRCGTDIILFESRTKKLWYNTDYQVKDMVVVDEVSNLKELINSMKEKGIDLSNMVTNKGILIGNDDVLSQNLNCYTLEKENQSKKRYETFDEFYAKASDEQFASFRHFFNTIEGHNYTDEEIGFSCNDDDLKDYYNYLDREDVREGTEEEKWSILIDYIKNIQYQGDLEDYEVYRESNNNSVKYYEIQLDDEDKNEIRSIEKFNNIDELIDNWKETLIEDYKDYGYVTYSDCKKLGIEVNKEDEYTDEKDKEETKIKLHLIEPLNDYQKYFFKDEKENLYCTEANGTGLYLATSSGEPLVPVDIEKYDLSEKPKSEEEEEDR